MYGMFGKYLSGESSGMKKHMRNIKAGFDVK